MEKHKKKILIIEDNDQNRQLVSKILTYHGYEVAEARNGQEGVRLAKELLPDLLLLDIQMPIMDGFAVIKELRNHEAARYLKIIALTSFAMPSDRERIFKAGFDDYIVKPIDTRQFADLIRRHVG